MARILVNSRYLVIIPIIGLAIAASFFFIFGGFGLIRLLVDVFLAGVGLSHEAVVLERSLLIFEVVEYVHTFLLGTVLYITAMGLYQLFVQEINFPNWLKIDSTEELETNLIGVTVVVLAVNFMGAVLVRGTDNLLQYGAGIALPIAALGLFVGLRAWSVKLNKSTSAEEEKQLREARNESTRQDPAEG